MNTIPALRPTTNLVPNLLLLAVRFWILRFAIKNKKHKNSLITATNCEFHQGRERLVREATLTLKLYTNRSQTQFTPRLPALRMPCLDS